MFNQFCNLVHLNMSLELYSPVIIPVILTIKTLQPATRSPTTVTTPVKLRLVPTFFPATLVKV